MRIISEDAADDATRRTFADIKQALGLPVLRVFFPALAVYPQFLQLHWKMLQPVVHSGEFFDLADRLRADAYTRAHNYLHIPDLCARLQPSRFSPAACQELATTMEMFHYKNPLLLLLFCAQLQALEGPVGAANAPAKPAAHPIYGEPPVFVQEENASSPVRHRYEEIRRVLDLPYVNAEYEAMARFPDFLHVYWEFLKSELQSPLYQECQYGIRETAWSLSHELPGPLELPIELLTDSGMKQDEISSVARILELFVKNLGSLIMNVAIAKIGLEGGNVTAPLHHAEKPDSERVA